jgi:hypothetical protein
VAIFEDLLEPQLPILFGTALCRLTGLSVLLANPVTRTVLCTRHVCQEATGQVTASLVPRILIDVKLVTIVITLTSSAFPVVISYLEHVCLSSVPSRLYIH